MPNPYSDALGRPQPEGKPPRRKALHPSQKRAKKQEKEAAKYLKGVVTPASGSGVIKGDVRVRRIARVECKTTKNKSFPVTLHLMAKIEDAAIPSGEAPVLLVEFNDGFGRKLGEVAIIPSYLLREFCDVQE